MTREKGEQMETMVVDEIVTGDMEYVMGDMSITDDMDYMIGMDEMTEGTQELPLGDKLMGSWVFIGGVAAAVLAVGVLLGILSAKRKIKKGIDLYED